MTMRITKTTQGNGANKETIDAHKVQPAKQKYKWLNPRDLGTTIAQGRKRENNTRRQQMVVRCGEAS